MAPRKIVLLREIYLFLLCVQPLRSEENIALGKLALQRGTYGGWPADKGVDGCLEQRVYSDCCAVTASNQKQTWWQVDLGSRATTSYITIYYRDETYANFRNRFAGYQLYLSNTTDWTQGVLCYNDTGSDLSAVKLIITHKCPYVAQYVTIYNYSGNPKRQDWYDDYAFLELCEVQVYGCARAKYGYGDCSQSCSNNCYGGNCDASSGSCFYCSPGKWGDTCDNACPTDCGNGCISKNGSCTDCVFGKWGNTCDQDCSKICQGCYQSGSCKECTPGKYGNYCERDCPSNCIGSCDQDSGFCRDCVFGKWGNTCDQDCSKICQDCYQSGSCKDCSLGRYGQSCEMFCPTHCTDNGCERESGLCFDCKPGKHGVKCDLDCSTGCKYLFCEKNTGFCSECTDGMHGYRCNKTCPAGCDSNKCRRYDGMCKETDESNNTTAIAALATVAALCLIAAIVSFVCTLRMRTAAKTERSKEENQYTDIDMTQGSRTNTYEM